MPRPTRSLPDSKDVALLRFRRDGESTPGSADRSSAVYPPPGALSNVEKPLPQSGDFWQLDAGSIVAIPVGSGS